jgi:hypothetical protein
MMSCEIKIANSGVRLIEVVNLSGPQRGRADDNQVFEYRWAVYSGGETTQRGPNTLPMGSGVVQHRYGDGAPILLQRVLTEYNLLGLEQERARERWSESQKLDAYGVKIGDLVKLMFDTDPFTAGAHWNVRHVYPNGDLAVDWCNRRLPRVRASLWVLVKS